MSRIDADLVMQVFLPATALDEVVRRAQEEGYIARSEFEQKLEPGLTLEIACSGFLVIASVLWIIDFPVEQGVRVGLRLLRVSAGPDSHEVVDGVSRVFGLRVNETLGRPSPG